MGIAANGRAAILVSRDVEFGCVRQFLAFIDGQSERQVELFRDRKSALDWLGVGTPPA